LQQCIALLDRPGLDSVEHPSSLRYPLNHALNRLVCRLQHIGAPKQEVLPVDGQALKKGGHGQRHGVAGGLLLLLCLLRCCLGLLL
jgi:hypothetical protein